MNFAELISLDNDNLDFFLFLFLSDNQSKK